MVIKLSDLFEIHNGLSSSQVEIHDSIKEGYIPYLRPASTLQRSIAGYVEKSKIPSKYIFISETIYVSTDGEGSHSFSYVSSYSFVPNSNVVALVPKKKLTLNQKLFYAKCITMNRYKFSYGRKPKGDRLAIVLLPEISEIPKWVERFDTKIYLDVAKPKIQNKTLTIPAFQKLVTLDSLFKLENGIGSAGLDEKPNRFKNSVIYVRPASTYKRTLRSFIDKNNVSPSKIYPVGTLFVSTNGEGSHSYSYVSTEAIVPNSDVSVLIPKAKMSIEEKLYYARCITANRFLFSYGRKPKGKRLLSIKVPDIKGKDVIEFIHSLKYSNVL